MRTNLQKLKPCYGTTYIRHINGLYLGMKDKTLHLSTERFLWKIESFENDRFYLKDINDKDIAEYWWNNIQVAPDSGYTEQHWYLHSKDNLILIEHVDTNKFLHYSINNELVVCEENDYKEGFYFMFENPSFTDGYNYIAIQSLTNKFSLRFEPRILNIVNQSWLKDWINDLEKAYYSLSRLVGFEPFPTIEIRTYTNCNHWGYIYYGKPIIHINKVCFENEIIRMRKRKVRDISFGALHELSHLFDKHYWIFDGEALANIKIPYVLQELDFIAAFDDDRYTITHNNYVEELYKEHGRLDDIKGLFCSSLAAKFTEIATCVGWDVFSNAFKNFPALDSDDRVLRFETFINKLSEYSSRNIRSMFTDAEWNSVIKNLKN